MSAKPVTAQLADDVIERLAKSYDLVYVDYRDELDGKALDALVRGDEWTENLWEWEADSKYESCKYIIEELVTEVARVWEVEPDDLVRELRDDVEEFDRVRWAIEERDTGGWVNDLLRNTPNVLLRISVIDEDSSYSFEEVKPRRVLKDVGLPATRANVANVDQLLAEVSPEYSVLMGYWIVGADVSDIYELPIDPETEVEIVNPYLYLGNTFTGSGFISERPFDGTVRVKRGDLRTDSDAFGYAVDEVYGGLNPNDFECKIRPVSSEET